MRATCVMETCIAAGLVHRDFEFRNIVYDPVTLEVRLIDIEPPPPGFRIWTPGEVREIMESESIGPPYRLQASDPIRLRLLYVQSLANSMKHHTLHTILILPPMFAQPYFGNGRTRIAMKTKANQGHAVKEQHQGCIELEKDCSQNIN
ncbi:predicted protein [Uncinocarpus reesii 1704]|uniref:Protein kinase domain-containing protein n=1 Tax=Uncinocarpus reesii (strain UAMH 1704) TaxID=336963 RepID=C4JH39_UNCRE|nr:uncharacterized protein UREG_01290 [Uncinocarpus reesii 1704]EEP76441.1 predicted protein [Uncinocarpus reesii 1704]